MNKLKTIYSLTKELNQYRHEYYNLAKPSISDSTYDRLFDELRALEHETGVSLANSPTNTVGYEVVSKLTKVKHSHPMLSLDKCHTVEEVIKFANCKDVLAMMKMDGLTVSAEYNNGVLTKLETRGNGEEGNDILFHAKAFENLPLTIEYKNKYIIDGEAIITYEDFNTINSVLIEKATQEALVKGLTGKEFDKYIKDNSYANPRNLASGTLNLLDSSISAKRHLKFVTWDVIEGDDSNILSERLDYAKNLGFTVVPFYQCNKMEMVSKESKYSNLDFIREQAREISYPIDGVVFKFQDIAYGKSLGKTGHHFNCGIAYKYEDDKYPTKLLDIEWTMGKTGTLTPTVITEPVEIDGTMVERASVHNVSIFKQFGFTKDCTCYLYKANQIIPQCDCVENNNGELYEIPTICPICGGKTEIQKPNDSEILVCTNEDCKGKLLGKLSHFVSKNAINIDGMSEATIEFFIYKGWVKNFSDLYNLEQHRNEWYKCEGFGKKSVDRLIKAIETSRNTTLDRFIYALSIPLIGRSASKIIAKRFDNNVDNFINYCKVFSTEYKNDLEASDACEKYTVDWTAIEGFDTKTHRSIVRFIRTNTRMIEDLINEVKFIKEEKKETNLKDLTGVTFVITGSVNTFKNRDEFKELVESLGGKVSGSVSAKTNFLVNNDVNSTTGKNKKAIELKVKIISEIEFNKMIGR